MQEQEGNQQPDMTAEQNDLNDIDRVIGVVSGKGGVGKSLTTVLIAQALAAKGYKVGILDADVTGPSIPHILGLENVRASALGNLILPAETEDGIKAMSVNLLLERSTDPVIWRGPVISGMVQNFWNQVVWGDIDYMVVDMPPGTGDVALTVFQQIPIDGIVVVTSPAELVSMIVGKAVKMADSMEIPILGIIENMAYLNCPHCEKRIDLFGESHLDDVARTHRLEILDRIPMDPALAQASDQGRPGDLNLDYIQKTLECLEKIPAQTKPKKEIEDEPQEDE